MMAEKYAYTPPFYSWIENLDCFFSLSLLYLILNWVVLLKEQDTRNLHFQSLLYQVWTRDKTFIIVTTGVAALRSTRLGTY